MSFVRVASFDCQTFPVHRGLEYLVKLRLVCKLQLDELLL